MELTIRTNNHWREFVQGYELTETEQEEFDFLDWNDPDGSGPRATFIRYKGELYYDEFQRINPMWKLHYPDDQSGFDTWHGYMSDSYFSGLLIRYSEDCEQYQIATYTS